MSLHGSITNRFVSARSGGFADREALTCAPFQDGDVRLSLSKSVTGNLQIDVYGLHHGHVRFLVRLPYIAGDEVDIRVSWSATGVRLFIDGLQLDEWRVPRKVAPLSR